MGPRVVAVVGSARPPRGLRRSLRRAGPRPGPRCAPRAGGGARQPRGAQRGRAGGGARADREGRGCELLPYLCRPAPRRASIRPRERVLRGQGAAAAGERARTREALIEGDGEGVGCGEYEGHPRVLRALRLPASGPTSMTTAVELDPDEFEILVTELLTVFGFEAQRTGRAGDGGVDVEGKVPRHQPVGPQPHRGRPAYAAYSGAPPYQRAWPASGRLSEPIQMDPGVERYEGQRFAYGRGSSVQEQMASPAGAPRLQGRAGG